MSDDIGGITYIEEALGALASDPHFSAAGIDAAFNKMFVRNCKRLDRLPDSAREKVKQQWGDMAYEMSMRTSVLQKCSEEKSRQMAHWVKHLNLLLALVAAGECSRD